MDEPILTEFSDDFSEELIDYCEAPAPEPAFVSKLERQLLERQAVLRLPAQEGSSVKRLWEQFSGSFAQRKWQYAVIVLLAALTIVLFAIGPQRVLAQVQRWMGYVPGIGFVDLKQARTLAVPASSQREGVTLQIDQALAEPDRTLVVISSLGLAAEPDDHLSSRFDILPEPKLHLPDGSILEVTRQELYYGGGKLEFPALPKGIYKITFEIDRLPFLPSGAAPEDWQMPLILRPATGELPAGIFPQPYAPEDAISITNGVKAQILQVAQSSQETALQIRFEWEDPGWRRQDGSFPSELQDDLGNIYHPINSNGRVASAVVQEAAIEESPTVTERWVITDSVETLYFPALSLAAREAVIRLPSLEFSIPDTADLTFDPGVSPQLGQIWNLDELMEVGGIPLHLVGARLDMDDQTFPDAREPFYSLEFTFRSPADLPRSLSIFFLETDLEGFHGGGGGTQEPGEFKIEMLFEKIPQEPIDVIIERVWITLQGPWEIRWQIPWTGEALQTNNRWENP